MDIDYEKIGFKCGLEIHQELDTGKLFCNCSSRFLEKDEITTIKRTLRPVAGETGHIDATALFEFKKKHHFVYHAYKGEACLVDMDAEPPHDINERAKKLALLFAMLLNMDIPKEIHVMRKAVTDGSATSGFQRTALFALGNDNSYIETSKGRIHMLAMALEEDSSKIMQKKGNEIHYSLSRLGIPLIELVTAPDIKDPEHAKETALKIGSLFRSFPQVKRGIGTIRQDINISIQNGIRTEIKGWQDANKISLLVENEVKRHIFLNSLKSELEKKHIKSPDKPPQDVTDIFIRTRSRLISGLIAEQGVVLALKLPGFAGILKREICPKKTFGKELADYAKSFSADGMIHTDEDLSKYRLVHEFNLLRKKLNAKETDLVLIIVERKHIAEKATNAVLNRVKHCFTGIPAETRVPNHVDATTNYSRPLSGAHRMYPETDVGTITTGKRYLAEIRKDMPETLDSKKDRFEKELELNSELASAIISSPYLSLFEILAEKYHQKINARDIANLFVNTLKDLKKRENIDIAKIPQSRYDQILKVLSEGKILKDATPALLKIMSQHPELFAEEIIKNYNLEPINEKEAKDIIKAIISKNSKAPQNAIIGIAMSELKGRFEGKKIAILVGEILGNG